MKIVTWLIPVAGALLVSGHALAGDAAGTLIDHPAVSVARTGVRPAYEDANKVYGHPAGGRAGAAAATRAPATGASFRDDPPHRCPSGLPGRHEGLPSSGGWHFGRIQCAVEGLEQLRFEAGSAPPRPTGYGAGSRYLPGAFLAPSLLAPFSFLVQVRQIRSRSPGGALRPVVNSKAGREKTAREQDHQVCPHCRRIGARRGGRHCDVCRRDVRPECVQASARRVGEAKNRADADPAGRHPAHAFSSGRSHPRQGRAERAGFRPYLRVGRGTPRVAGTSAAAQ